MLPKEEAQSKFFLLPEGVATAQKASPQWSDRKGRWLCRAQRKHLQDLLGALQGSPSFPCTCRTYPSLLRHAMSRRHLHQDPHMRSTGALKEWLGGGSRAEAISTAKRDGRERARYPNPTPNPNPCLHLS